MLGHFAPGQTYPGRAGTAMTFAAAAMISVYLGGVDVSAYVDFDTAAPTKEDELNDVPDTFSFTTYDVVPLEGQPLLVLRSVYNREFSGKVLEVNQFYDSIRHNIGYRVTAQDKTWDFNRRLVTKRWTTTSGTTIAQEIVAFAPGFTTTAIEAGLATLDEFEVILKTPGEALKQLGEALGGVNFYIDYEASPGVHVFTAEVTEAPDDIADLTKSGDRLAHKGSSTQRRTRIRGTGGGTSASETIPAGRIFGDEEVHDAATIPIDDATMFASAGGTAISGPNIPTYTGKHDGGVAGKVTGNVAAPSGGVGSGTPAVAVAANVVGVLQGAYQYKVAYGNAAGETAAGPASGVVTGVAFAAPAAASVAASGAIGKLFGIYLYVCTYLTALGETTAGASFGRTAVAVAAPGAVTLAAGSTIGKLIGAYGYKATFRTPFGETAAGTLASRTGVATAAPSAPSIAVVDTGVNTDMGKLIGAYGYKVALVSAFGESAASTAGSRTAVAQTAPVAPSSLSSSAPGPLVGTYGWKVAYVGPDGKESMGSALSGQVIAAATADTPGLTSSGGATISYRISYLHPFFGETAWSSAATDASAGASTTVTFTGVTDCATKIYSVGGGHPSTDPYYHVATIPAGTTSYVHTTATGPEAFSPIATLGKSASFTIPTGPTGTVSRRIYRTRAGGSAYYLSGEVGDNSTTTFTDATPDTALTVGAPTQNLNGEQHTVSSIATGPTGTTKRYIYRTESGGSIYYFLREIPDNSTTSFVDNATDAELDKGRTALATGTMGDQHALTAIPTGPTGTLARVIYRTEAGGSSYKKLVEIGDNATTTYTDNMADADLGVELAPSVSTAGGEAHALTSIPTGPTGTLGRNIYRTIAGGTAYQFVGQLTDNVATTFTDNRADAELGDYVPLVNTAGANKIAVSSIPIGGTGVTKRILYRTEAGGTLYKYVGTLNDNTTTVFTDNVPDTSLGREALTQGTIGAQVADTTLTLESIVGFPAFGWVNASNQLIYYGGISGNILTDIPGPRACTITRSGTTATVTTTGNHLFTTGQNATIQGAVETAYNGSHQITMTGPTTFTFVVAGAPATPATGTIVVLGPGAILTALSGGQAIVTAPFLILSDVPGVASHYYPILRGQSVRIHVVRNDTGAQTQLAAAEGDGDGVIEATIDDSSILTVGALEEACDAELTAFADSIKSITFRSRDPKLRSGKTITLNLGAPTNLSGAFLIQRVVTTEYNITPHTYPLRTVTAAPVFLSFQNVVRRRQLHPLPYR